MKAIKYDGRIETRNDKNELHSFNDKPAIKYNDLTKEWYKEGKLHRLNGPAVDYIYGTKFWYKEGKRHRLDGPAREFENGDKEWYYENKQIGCSSIKEFLKIINLKAFW